MSALYEQLKQEGFWSRFNLNDNNRVLYLIFAHPGSLTYLQIYPDTLLLDYTYKTNKYKMALLDIIGVDACRRSFCIAFVFLRYETEADFNQALDHLKSLYIQANIRLPFVILIDYCLACMNAVSACFPSSAALLCLWYANKAVLRECQPIITKKGGPKAQERFFQMWHSIIRSPDKEPTTSVSENLNNQNTLTKFSI